MQDAFKDTYHFYATRLLQYVGLSIDSIDNIEIFIEKHDIEINMYKNIDGKDIFKFLNDEKFGIYQKFDIRMLLNREIEDDIFYALKIVNKVLQSQYGVKVKKKGKKNPVYFLSTGDMWSNLPNDIIKGKDLIEYKAKDKDNENVLSNLDNDLFADSSDEEEDKLVDIQEREINFSKFPSVPQGKEIKSVDIIINIKLPILIPENYIYDLSLRLSIYRKLGELRSNEDFMLFEEEMINRFGLIPNEFKNLIELIKLKVLAAKTKIIRIDANQEYINIYFMNLVFLG